MSTSNVQNTNGPREHCWSKAQ